MPSRKTSIAVIVVVALVAVTTLLLGTLGIANYSQDRDRQWAKLRSDLAADADQHAVGLALPVWNIDRAQIDKIIESMMKQQDIYAVVVTAAGKRHARARDAQWGIKAVDREISPAGLLDEERPISFANEAIGTLRVFATPKFIEEELRNTLISTIVIILIFDLLLILCIYLLLWRTVLNPLRELERYAVAVSTGSGTRVTIQGTRYQGELEILRASIELMVGQLDGRYVTLQEEIKRRQKSEERLRATIENTPHVAMQFYDEEGRVLFWNRASEHVFGWKAADAMGKTLDRLIHTPEEATLFRELLGRIKQTGETVGPAEYEFRRKDGTKGVCLSTTFAIPSLDGAASFVCMDVDVTERKRTEQELQTLKNYLANIIDSMPSILVGVDREENVTQWNKRAETVTGIPAGQAVGRSLAGLLPDFSPWIGALRGDLEEHRPAIMERLLIVKGGERHFYDLMLYPLVADSVEGAVVRIEDVTERTRIQELMIQTEKMMSVGGLAAGMAHEINNPLGIITQAAQNIERRVMAELPANLQAAAELCVGMEILQAYFRRREIPDFIRDIREASARAARIVANMLQFSRRSEANMQLARLDELLERTVELAANDYDLKKKYDFRSIEIAREFDPALPPIPVLVVEIEQVVLNLMKNAAQAMAGNPPERQPKITLRLRREENYVLLEVADNGPGMADDVRRRVFEPFFTTKEPGIGTGLGLSVSYMIVTHNHKGLMAVESAPENGARFSIRLPLTQEE